MSLDLEGLRIGLSELATVPDEIPLEQVPGLVAELARAQAALLVATCRPAPPRAVEQPNEDRMLDVDEAAELLGVKPAWVYRHARKLPFTRRISAKVVRFSRQGILRWLAARRPLNDVRT
jgi:predicted DNA-binding transcriptional regulator AlpA